MILVSKPKWRLPFAVLSSIVRLSSGANITVTSHHPHRNGRTFYCMQLADSCPALPSPGKLRKSCAVQTSVDLD